MTNPIFVLRADEDPKRGAYRTLFRPELPVKGSFVPFKEVKGFIAKAVNPERNAAFGTAPLAEIERLLALPNTPWKPMAASDPDAIMWLD